MQRTALVAGASGIAGRYVAGELIDDGWIVYGLARRPMTDLPGLLPVAADLRDATSLASALEEVAPTHVFITTWMRNATEAENIRVNSAMVRNLLDVLAPKRMLRHRFLQLLCRLPRDPLAECVWFAGPYLGVLAAVSSKSQRTQPGAAVRRRPGARLLKTAYRPPGPRRKRRAAFCAWSSASTRSEAVRASACAASMLGKNSGMRYPSQAYAE